MKEVNIVGGSSRFMPPETTEVWFCAGTCSRTGHQLLQGTTHIFRRVIGLHRSPPAGAGNR